MASYGTSVCRFRPGFVEAKVSNAGLVVRSNHHPPAPICWYPLYQVVVVVPLNAAHMFGYAAVRPDVPKRPTSPGMH